MSDRNKWQQGLTLPNGAETLGERSSRAIGGGRRRFSPKLGWAEVAGGGPGEALHLCEQEESDSGWVTQDHVAGRGGEAVGALRPCRAHMGGHSYQKAANVGVHLAPKKEVEADG